ncbi:hypothetical protein ACFS5N_00310 [Mucilaginibacter ximonensis]|uniref:DUF2207 domain-containing protein n=1 Tax=Mucilaginibacter ximonensis TaxID=538021 RepID=A0ABW5Y810_9SPHI
MAVVSICLMVTPDAPTAEHRLAPFMLIASILYFIGFLRKKVTIENDVITHITTFNKRQLTFDEIEGVKFDNKAIILTPKSRHTKELYIHDYKQLKDYKILIHFLKSVFQNIDTIKLKQGLANQEYDTTYGFTPEQRAEALTKFNKIASVINLAGIAFALTVFIPFAIFQAIGITLPLMCMILAFITDKRIKLSSKYGPVAYPVIATAYILPIITLFLKSFLSYDLYNSKNLWLPSLSFGCLTILAYYFININEMPDVKRTREMIPFALLFFAYAFASVRIINCAFDTSTGRRYQPIILNRDISKRWGEYGESNDYNLVLSAWGPDKKTGEIQVSQKLYEKTRVGDRLNITVKPGLLDIPWYTIDK